MNHPRRFGCCGASHGELYWFEDGCAPTFDRKDLESSGVSGDWNHPLPSEQHLNSCCSQTGAVVISGSRRTRLQYSPDKDMTCTRISAPNNYRRNP